VKRNQETSPLTINTCLLFTSKYPGSATAQPRLGSI